MRVDHRRSHILVSKELLHSTDVVSIFEKMGGKGVPKCVTGSPFGDPRFLHGPFEGFLQNGCVDMMTAFPLGSGILPPVLLRKNPLPAPLGGCVGIFAIQRVRHQDKAPAIGQVPFVNPFDLSQVLL